MIVIIFKAILFIIILIVGKKFIDLVIDEHNSFMRLNDSKSAFYEWLTEFLWHELYEVVDYDVDNQGMADRSHDDN